METPIRERRAPQAPRAKHRAIGSSDSFTKSFKSLADLAFRGARVSASAADITSGRELLQIDDSVVLPTASVGKVLLLIEVAAAIGANDSRSKGLAERTVLDFVGDSGVWRHLQAPTLPLRDVAALVGAVSDNVATNVLLSRFGLDAVRARVESMGMRRSALLDRVRDHRGLDDAPQLSVGSTAELVWLFSALSRGEVVDYATSHLVLGWLALNTDLSMVASAFGLDPLSHGRIDHGLALANKTGSDKGVRSEAGILRGPRAGVAYAVTVTFDDASLEDRLLTLDAMRTVGFDLLDHVH